MDHTILCVILFFHSVSGNLQRCRQLTLENGKVKFRNRDRTAKFTCNDKFQLFGNKNAACIKGVWNQDPPVCIANRCRELEDLPIGVLMETSFGGALLSFTCLDPTRILNGSNQIYCEGKEWSSVPPTCVSMEPPKQCDFEAKYIPLCGWTQDQDDDFDWTLISGRTLTEGTGPQSDHTFGNTSTGHYIYIETSSPRRPGETARLISPVFYDVTSFLCLEFYYHMMTSPQTNGVGKLEVSLKTEDQIIGQVEPKLCRSGNQGVNWTRGQVDIGYMNVSFQIVISASRGTSYAGDIAVDDVRLYNCNNMTHRGNFSSEESLILNLSNKGNSSYGGNGDSQEGSSTPITAVNHEQETGILNISPATNVKSTVMDLTVVKPNIATSKSKKRPNKQVQYSLQRNQDNIGEQNNTTPGLKKRPFHRPDLLNDNVDESIDRDKGHDVSLYVGIGLGTVVVFLASMALILRLDPEFKSSNGRKKNQKISTTPSSYENVGTTFQGGDGVIDLAIELNEIKKELSDLKACFQQVKDRSPHNSYTDTDNAFSRVLDRMSFIDEEIDEIIGKRPVALSIETTEEDSTTVRSALHSQNTLSDTDDSVLNMDIVKNKHASSMEHQEDVVFSFPEIVIHCTENNQNPVAFADEINKTEKDSKSQEKEPSYDALADKKDLNVSTHDPCSSSNTKDDVFGQKKQRQKNTLMTDLINKMCVPSSGDDSVEVKRVQQQHVEDIEMHNGTCLVEQEMAFRGTNL